MSATRNPVPDWSQSERQSLESSNRLVQNLNAAGTIRVSAFESFEPMKLTRLFSIVPVLSVAVLLATPSTGLSDRKKITVYQDNDGDGHYHKKKIEVPDRHHYSHGHSGYYRPYPYAYRHPYTYRPSVSVNVHRSYSSGYSDDLAEDVQRELRRRGYYRGSIDGDVGPGTRSAISRYQYDRGLPVNGRIDRNLIRALGID